MWSARADGLEDGALLRRAEDTHVEKLYDFAPMLGAHWIEAHFPRSYLDANRNTSELDISLLNEPWSHPVETNPALLTTFQAAEQLIVSRGVRLVAEVHVPGVSTLREADEVTTRQVMPVRHFLSVWEALQFLEEPAP